MKKLIPLLFLIPLVWSGCYYDNLEELSLSNKTGNDSCIVPDTVSYAADIQPILNSRCGSGDVACHDASNAISGGGSSGSFVNYSDSYETINDRGPVDFMQRVNHDPGISSSKYMPKGTSAKIEACSIQKLQKWIDQGLQNN